MPSILLAETSTVMRRAVEIALAPLGIDLHVVTDTATAYQHARAELPIVALLGKLSPQDDITFLAKRLRGEVHIPVVWIGVPPKGDTSPHVERPFRCEHLQETLFRISPALRRAANESRPMQPMLPVMEPPPPPIEAHEAVVIDVDFGDTPKPTPEMTPEMLTMMREIIERVVWEVVPALAEALIKEEMHKKKAG